MTQGSFTRGAIIGFALVVAVVWLTGGPLAVRRPRHMLKLQGAGWEGDLLGMRSSRFPRS